MRQRVPTLPTPTTLRAMSTSGSGRAAGVARERGSRDRRGSRLDDLAHMLRVVRLDQVAKRDHERRQAPEAQLSAGALGELADHLRLLRRRILRSCFSSRPRPSSMPADCTRSSTSRCAYQTSSVASAAKPRMDWR